MYQQHPSVDLNELFRHRPFQGAVPESARFIFVGLDANYHPNLELSPSFRDILEYHSDGVRFWQRHGVHHPFLLPTYRGDGRRYHANFSKIGFTPAHAGLVSFIELLHVPTVGRSRLEARDLDRQHLVRVNRLATAGRLRSIFLSPGVVRLMLTTKQFDWLAPPRHSSQVLPVLHSHGDTRIYLHLHLSNYGKYQAQLAREAQAIARLVCGMTPSSSFLTT